MIIDLDKTEPRPSMKIDRTELEVLKENHKQKVTELEEQLGNEQMKNQFLENFIEDIKISIETKYKELQKDLNKEGLI